MLFVLVYSFFGHISIEWSVACGPNRRVCQVIKRFTNSETYILYTVPAVWSALFSPCVIRRKQFLLHAHINSINYKRWKMTILWMMFSRVDLKACVICKMTGVTCLVI